MNELGAGHAFASGTVEPARCSNVTWPSAPDSASSAAHQPHQPPARQLDFLAEIITTLELEPDAPEKNRLREPARAA